jgi:hypothetical protein
VTEPNGLTYPQYHETCPTRRLRVRMAVPFWQAGLPGVEVRRYGLPRWLCTAVLRALLWLGGRPGSVIDSNELEP